MILLDNFEAINPGNNLNQRTLNPANSSAHVRYSSCSRFDPHGNLIPPVDSNIGKYSVRTHLGRNANTALKINRPSLEVAGTYRVKVFTQDHAKEEKFSLIVRSKPKVQVRKSESLHTFHVF